MELNISSGLGKQKKSIPATIVDKQNKSPQKADKLLGQKYGKQTPESLGGKRDHVSSLFNCNPEIPQIAFSKQKRKEEHLFTEKKFGDLGLHSHLVSCLHSRLNVEMLTEVQNKTIPMILAGKDVLVKSCTGSGKTLAYAVPIVQILQSKDPKIQRADGTYALVILPTRELALQSFECFSALTKAFTWIVPGYLIGGEKKKSEKARIRKGINILISTPGRLLDHFEHTNNLNLSKVKWLVIDEADRLLEQGFEEAALKIVSRVKQDAKLSPQTVLLSATLSREVEKLAGISLANPVYIDVAAASDNSEKMTELIIPSQLKQYVAVTPTKLRLVTLSAFIVEQCSKGSFKALIFMSTQNIVDFHFILFNFILKGMLKIKGYRTKIFKLHGKMKQEDRTEVFNKFKASELGILLCTDVAARGLDMPHVNWIIQYSVPVSVESYVHRVGRTARIGNEGQSLLFLIPSEVKFANVLQQRSICLEELNMTNVMKSLLLITDVIQETAKQSWRSKPVQEHATALQLKFENVIYSDENHHTAAKEAFLSFVQAYSSYPKELRFVIPFKMLHLGHVAKSFCLRETPSELGCHSVKGAGSYKHRAGKDTREKESRKRKHSECDSGIGMVKPRLVSEFDSGFSAWKEETILQSKKQKKRQ